MRENEALNSPPQTAIRRSNRMRSQTPQSSDVSDDDARTAEEATPTPDARTHPSEEPPITPLQAPIAFETGGNATTDSQSLEAILQA